MADAVIGALRVLLGLDTAAFSSGAKEASSTLNQFVSGFKKAIGGLSLGAVAYAFERSIKSMIDQADNLNKAAQKFGVPVEQLSALKYAADLADVSFESLGKGLGKLSKAILEGATNPASDAAKNFQALGISVRDATGQIKPTDTVFTDIAQKFSTMEDGATKTALAIRLFGRSGADLIPLLNAGRGGIKSLTDEAKRLGIVISTETAAKAEEFNDTLKRLETIQKAAFLQMAEGLLPALQSLANAFLNAAQDGSSLKSFFDNIGETLKNDIQDIQKIGLAFENLARIIAAFRDLPSNIAQYGVGAALQMLDAVLDENKRRVDALHRSFLSLGAAGAFEGMDNLFSQLDKLKRGFGGINEAALHTKNAVEEFLSSQAKSIAATNSQAQTLGSAIGVAEGFKLVTEAYVIAQEKGVVVTGALAQKINDMGVAAQNAAINLAAAKLTQEALSPWDEYQKKLQDINIILERHPEIAAAAAEASAKAAAKMTEAYGATAATAAGNFATFFKEFGKGNKAMFEIGKAFSISQAIINTYVGATKALAEGGPILGPILAASIVAAGLASVAKIVAEKPPAMATGGTLMVGGAGGIDSKMIPIMASPGEKVTVDQNKYGEGGSSKTITLAGIKAKDYYRGDILRDLVENLNEAIGDGLKIKLA